jgi:hypothetical protein
MLKTVRIAARKMDDLNDNAYTFFTIYRIHNNKSFLTNL